MRIRESDVDEIKSVLQKSFHAGHRWVVYEDQEHVSGKSMMTVATAASANAYCQNRYTEAGLFKYKAIASVLKSVFEAEGRLIAAPANDRRLEMEIKRLSILPTHGMMIW